MKRLTLIPQEKWYLHTQGTSPQEGTPANDDFNLWGDVLSNALKDNPDQADQAGLLILDASRTETQWPRTNPEELITFPTFGAYGFKPVGSQFTLGLKEDMENPLNPKGTLRDWKRLINNYFLNENHSSTYGSCLGFCRGESPFIYNPQNPDVHFHAPTQGDHDFGTFLRALQATIGLVCKSNIECAPLCAQESPLGCSRIARGPGSVFPYSFLK